MKERESQGATTREKLIGLGLVGAIIGIILHWTGVISRIGSKDHA